MAKQLLLRLPQFVFGSSNHFFQRFYTAFIFLFFFFAFCIINGAAISCPGNENIDQLIHHETSRINYIIKKLYEHPVYREYKITYLAEECGYVTPRVFVNAFKQQMGFTPSYFVEQLKASA
ncbi:AraC family transcriptional regulator [Chryseobacterium sp.]|uniref:AraC family transcriptional regulator n=1 Tax=Chryseobacterium sp. TaxID=1871047 RepID=UPI0024E1D7F7|nr:AraC family transcriptional regulator [Chryseobacterium sp.]